MVPPSRHHLRVTGSTVRPSTILKSIVRGVDPRRSLVAGLIWLVVALAAAFASTASWWVGRVAREIVVQQHMRRLVLETDQLGSDLGQSVIARLAAARAAGQSPDAAGVFAYLAGNYPELGWIAAADDTGAIVAGDGSIPLRSKVEATPWFAEGRLRPWLGTLGLATSAHAPVLGDLALPVMDPTGRLLAVVAAHLTWRWAAPDLQRLSTSLDPRGSAQTLVVDAEGRVLVGPDLVGKRWRGTVLDAATLDPGPPDAPRFERMPDGRIVLVASAPIALAHGSPIPGWRVQLSEPREQVYRRANALAARILWISICLGTLTALLGALGARHLTNRLRRLTRSAVAVGRDVSARIEVPQGRDEVAQLAAVFAKILDDLRQERGGLLTLSTELERRVALRTREVERLAEEARYAAIVRERLKIARDLHDTLAHSMMAMLSEVRLLRKLQVHDPHALPDELARAEQVAQDGLNEARNAITQMRLHTVRDTGLGAALARAFERFRDHTGLICAFSTDPEAARFGDERAETLFRMAEEALRNIERHAMATRVTMSLATVGGTHVRLSVIDDGVGFDPGAPRPGHYGLVGLREQAQLVGADLDIVSAPNEGTTLTVTLRIGPEALQPGYADLRARR